MHQVADLRTGRSPVQFISEQQEREYNQGLAAFRARIPREVRFVVGQGQRVLVRDGTWREQGAAIVAADISDEAGYPDKGRAGWSLFDDMVAREQVIENYNWKPRIDAQQHPR